MARLSRTAARKTPSARRSCARRGRTRGLVRECIGGSEEAWCALIFKYKNLIFSIPVKYGFSADDSTDIFQAVCLDLLSELPKLRKVKALPKWIMQITAHKCFHRKQQQQRTERSGSGCQGIREEHSLPRGRNSCGEAEDEQNLRQAMAELPPRCRELVHMLFYDEPVAPVSGNCRVAGDRGRLHRLHPAAMPGTAAQTSAGNGIRVKSKSKKAIRCPRTCCASWQISRLNPAVTNLSRRIRGY